MRDMVLPQALTPIAAYLDRARELRARHPIPAHTLRILAMHIGLQQHPDNDAKEFLAALMGELEAERAGHVPAALSPHKMMSDLAMDLNARAIAADQASSTVQAPVVAQCFHAAAVLLDGCRLFAPLSYALQAMQHAAHMRSQTITSQLLVVGRVTGVPVWQPCDQAMLPWANAKSEASVVESPQAGQAAAAEPPIVPTELIDETPTSPSQQPESGKPMPRGWAERVDPVSGRTFFVNFVTKVRACAHDMRMRARE